MKISALVDNPAVLPTDIIPTSKGDASLTVKTNVADLADAIADSIQYSNLQTTSKTLVGAINEAAQSGGGGSDVEVTQVLTSGTKIATITVDGNDTNIYAENTKAEVQKLADDKTATGNPIAFSKVEAGYVKSLKVKMNPIQSGSGDPSPENIRPISGRNSVSATINGETKTVTFDHTVYGGEADLTEGKLPEDMAIVDMGDLTYSAITGSRYVQVLKNNIQEVTGKDIKRTADAFLITSIWTVLQTVNSVRFATDLTPEEFKTLVTGQTLCYELATPTESTFTPQSVALNKGENVISTDGDSVEAVYTEMITMDDVEQVSSGIDYSTTEQDTGQKWVDGSTIYQKTYVGNLASGDILLENFADKLPIGAEGWLKNGSGYGIILGAYISTSSNWWSALHINPNDELVILHGSELNSGNFYITVRYIKTT